MLENRRVLVVEDRQDWQEIIVRNLSDLDCQMDVAGNYEEAITLLESHHYHLAIIDPVLDNSNKYNRDGLRVLSEIHHHSPRTRLIVVSGSLSNSTLRKSTDLPPRLPVVEKPGWDRLAFKALVRQILEEGEYTSDPEPIALERTSPRATQEMPTLPQDRDRVGVPRVLIVEDRADWQIILSRIIEEQHWFWRVVGSSEEALISLQNQINKFNIVLLDLRLGNAEIPIREGEGWKLLDYLTKFEPRTKVIIVSGEASRGDVAALFMQYSLAGFIDKDTFQKTDLVELMRKLLVGTKLQVQTLGDFRIWRNGQLVDDFKPEQELFLKILLTRRGDAVLFDELAELLMPQAPAEFRSTNLSAVANAVRLSLEPNLIYPGDSTFIIRDEAAYRFNFSRSVGVDYEQIETILREGKHHEREGAFARAIKTYESAIKIYQGDYLPGDRSAQWTITMRNHLQKEYVRILNRLADLYARDRRLDEAVITAQLSIQHDAYHESTYRRLMRYHACQKHPDAALRVYHTLEKLLKEFFEEEPSPETRQLKDAIANGEQINCVERLKIS